MVDRREVALLETLRRRLRDAGVAVRAGRASAIRLKLGDELREVELRSARDARVAALRALLAEAILEARASRPAKVPFVAAPAISDAMARELREFAARVAPGQVIGIVDARGRLEIDGGEQIVILPPTDEPPAAFATVRRPTVFSDAHQWILKALLAPGLPEDLLTAPRAAQPVRSARGLAALAGVSLTSAVRFVGAFEGEGYLERTRRELRLVRVEELLHAWRAASRPRSEPIGVRWLIAPRDVGAGVVQLQGALAKAGVEAALGLHDASAALGFGFVAGATPTLYVADVRAAVSTLRSAGVVLSDERSPPDLFLDAPLSPRSCFAGAVARDGRRVTDVLQTWLDVSWHPARGQGQAEVLWDRALAPHLLVGSGKKRVRR